MPYCLLITDKVRHTDCMEDIFTARLREALKQSGISQQEFANKIKVCKQTVSDYKAGRIYPSIQTLRLICSALEVSADYLLGIEDDSGTKKYR